MPPSQGQRRGGHSSILSCSSLASTATRLGARGTGAGSARWLRIPGCVCWRMRSPMRRPRRHRRAAQQSKHRASRWPRCFVWWAMTGRHENHGHARTARSGAAWQRRGGTAEATRGSEASRTAPPQRGSERSRQEQRRAQQEQRGRGRSDRGRSYRGRSSRKGARQRGRLRGKRAMTAAFPKSRKRLRPFRRGDVRGENSSCAKGDSNPHGVTH